MESRLLLNVVVRQVPSVLQLLASEDEALLVRRDAFLVLDLGLHVLNGVVRLDVKSNGLASQGLNEDLHATAQVVHQGKCWLLLKEQAVDLAALGHVVGDRLLQWNAKSSLHASMARGRRSGAAHRQRQSPYLII